MIRNYTDGTFRYYLQDILVTHGRLSNCEMTVYVMKHINDAGYEMYVQVSVDQFNNYFHPLEDEPTFADSDTVNKLNELFTK